MHRIYNRQDYLIFLDNSYIKDFLNKNINKYFPGFIACLKVESCYFRVLAATSFLVRYFVTLKSKHGHEWTLRMRGNRLNPTSYKILSYLWQTHGYKKYYYPRPIYYFKKQSFILYENYDGMIYRDYHRKSKYFFNKTVPMIAKRLADLHRTPKKMTKVRTLNDEFAHLEEILLKIKNNHQPYYSTASEVIAIIKNYIATNYQIKNFTLIHNDFQASNIIYNRYGKNMGIIDYEQFCVFFPTIDVVTFTTHLKTVVRNILPEQGQLALQKKFIKYYLKYTKQKNLAKIKRDLPYFMARSLLDIMAVSAVYLSLSRHDQQKEKFREFIAYLEKEIAKLLPIIRK